MACCGGNPNCSRREDTPLDEITLKAGTVVKLDGLPFQLKEDTVVLGRNANLALVRPEKLEPVTGPR